MALLAAGERGEAVRRGVDYLGDTQRADGGWDEDYFTGTGFPGDFYLNYHLYRMVFPLSALGRFIDSEETA
jgi:squalene-hopene/tetraprenyl-beta-curcumene cyclase